MLHGCVAAVPGQMTATSSDVGKLYRRQSSTGASRKRTSELDRRTMLPLQWLYIVVRL